MTETKQASRKQLVCFVFEGERSGCCFNVLKACRGSAECWGRTGVTLEEGEEDLSLLMAVLGGAASLFQFPRNPEASEPSLLVCEEQISLHSV